VCDNCKAVLKILLLIRKPVDEMVVASLMGSEDIKVTV